MDVDNKNVEALNNMEKTDITEKNITHIQIINNLAVDKTINTDTEIIDMEKQCTPYASASSDESQSDYETAASDNEDNKTVDLVDKFSKLKCNPADLEVEGESEGKYVVDNILAPVNTSKSDESFEDENDEDEDDDDDSGWITPGKFNFINFFGQN